MKCSKGHNKEEDHYWREGSNKEEGCDMKALASLSSSLVHAQEMTKMEKKLKVEDGEGLDVVWKSCYPFLFHVRYLVFSFPNFCNN